MTGANPCSKSAIQSGSSEKLNVASTLAEKGKVRKYNDYLKPECWKFFVPFAFEYTCRLGVKATQFINDLCKLDNSDLASKILNGIVLCLLKKRILLWLELMLKYYLNVKPKAIHWDYTKLL